MTKKTFLLATGLTITAVLIAGWLMVFFHGFTLRDALIRVMPFTLGVIFVGLLIVFIENLSDRK